MFQLPPALLCEAVDDEAKRDTSYIDAATSSLFQEVNWGLRILGLILFEPKRFIQQYARINEDVVHAVTLLALDA